MTREQIKKEIKRCYNLRAWCGWLWLIVTENTSDENKLVVYICKDEPVCDKIGFSAEQTRVLGTIDSDGQGIKEDYKISKKEVLDYGENLL